ncbi:gp436 family protein [Inquilinus sp. OTU3971]|uniref:gp436 family protein n=1 Tax=Inquilinus sp. OTU3971 TaxID=3043855 RepID=UPI00313E5299
MTYATQAQLEDRYGTKLLGQLTDRGQPATGQVDAEVVERALLDTDATIDGYLAARYRLPIASAPKLLVDVAEAVAIYKLHRRAPDEKITADYRDAIKTLQDIAAGRQRLDLDGIEPERGNSSGSVSTSSPCVFTPDSLRGFV